MFEIYAVAAVALVAVGVIAGILVIFAVGVRSEDRAGSLRRPSPGRVAGGVRAATNAYVSPSLAENAGQRRPELALVGSARPGRPSVRTW